MRLYEYINNALELFRDGFNAYIDKINEECKDDEDCQQLKHINAFVGSEFELRNEELSIAIYLCSPNGTTYSETEKQSESGFTVSFYLNEDATAESEKEALLYYTALISFIKLHEFSEEDEIADSILILTSQGWDRNGAAVYVKSRLASFSDADYLEEILYG